MTTDDRRNRNVARYPDRRAHPFRSPWPTASMTVCENCGVRYGDHPATIAQDAQERPSPTEAWCARCDAPSTTVVTTTTGDHALCDRHAADLRYTITAPSFRHVHGRRCTSANCAGREPN